MVDGSPFFKSGFGTLIKADGTIYKGSWSINKMHGVFTVISPDGKSWIEKYNNGVKEN